MIRNSSETDTGLGSSSHEEGNLNEDAERSLLDWRVRLKSASRNLLHGEMRVRADSSDLAQEGILQILGKLSDIRADTDAQRDCLSKAVAKGTASKMIRHHMAQKRSVRRTQSCYESQLPNQVPNVDPGDQLERVEMMSQLLHAIEQLDEESKDLIVLCHFEELPLTVVAERLNITYRVATLRRKKALKQIKQELVRVSSRSSSDK